jgi:hypothetical protein
VVQAVTRAVARAVSIVMELLNVLRRELGLDDEDVDEILRAALGPAGRPPVEPVEVRDVSDEIVEIAAHGFAEVDTDSTCHADGFRLKCYSGSAWAHVAWQEALGIALRIVAVVARMAHERCAADCRLARCRGQDGGTCAERCDAMCARQRWQP